MLKYLTYAESTIHGVVDETYQSKLKSSQPIGYWFPFVYAYIGYIYWKNKERLK